MTVRAGQTVIEFPRDRLRTGTLREPGDGPAEVVFFTGIRIERLPEDGDTLPTTRRGLGRKGRSGLGRKGRSGRR